MIDNLQKLLQLAGIEEPINESETVNEVAPADQEEFVKKAKEKFKKKYGKRAEKVLYATAWKRHKNEVKESDDATADEIYSELVEFDRLAVLAGIMEADDSVEIIKFANPPVNKLELKGVDVDDDSFEVQKELTGRDELEKEKVDVPVSVTKAIDSRIKELKDSIEKFGGGGPQETALDKLEEFKKLLSSKNENDYKAAQILYGTLWTEISELLPTALVSFLHTGKDLEKTPIQ